MEILKNKEILEYYGIYQKRELSEKEKKKYLRIKRESEKLIKIPIEKMYLIEENAWGKNKSEKDAIYMCVDKRNKDIEEAAEKLQDYFRKRNIKIILRSLCSYEKRKNIPTEQEYFISEYGIEIYNSEKEPSINERIKETTYALLMESLNSLKPYIGEPMETLVQIYILKLGYPVNLHKSNIEEELKIIKMITKDEKAIKLIEEYIEEKNEKEKDKISKEFKEILLQTKQIKYESKLEKRPTMKVYERLLEEKEQKGTLDIKKLTKEELYIMYVTQGKTPYEIANLYGVETRIINNKRNNYNIKLKQKTARPENIKKLIEQTCKYKRFSYALNKYTTLNFEKYIIPILDYMKDDETYLLKEFWKFCKNDKNNILDDIVCKDENAYYKAELCVDLLLQNNLIKEVEYKQYKITQEGKKLLKHMWKYDINEIEIPIISEYLPNFKYYQIEYKTGYPKSIEGIEKIFKKLKEDVEKELNNNNIERSKGIYQYILAFINTIIEDKRTPEKIKIMPDVKDLKYMLGKDEEHELSLNKNIISSEIYKYIEKIEIRDIVKFAMANYNYFKNEDNIKIE